MERGRRAKTGGEELLALIKPPAILLYFPLLRRASLREAGRIYSVRAARI